MADDDGSPAIQQLALQVRARRRSLKLTQEALADLSGSSPRFVRALESGKPGIRMDKYLAVLRALGLSITFVQRRGSR